MKRIEVDFFLSNPQNIYYFCHYSPKKKKRPIMNICLFLLATHDMKLYVKYNHEISLNGGVMCFFFFFLANNKIFKPTKGKKITLYGRFWGCCYFFFSFAFLSLKPELSVTCATTLLKTQNVT